MHIPIDWSDYFKGWVADPIIGNSVRYQAPERIRGESLDHRADIYSAAMLVYELLTGKHPFPGGSIWQFAKKTLEDEPPAPSSVCEDVSPAFDPVQLKALSKDPEQRYASVAEFSAALRDAVGSNAVTERI